MIPILRAILAPPAILAFVSTIIWVVFQIPDAWVGKALALTAWALCSLVWYICWSD